jgi:small GTP-binding protein
MTDSLKSRKIVILGNRTVGKSSLTIRFVEKKFDEVYYPTIEHTFTKTVAYRNQDYSCEIVDTAGQDEFSILQSNYAIGVHGYILVYSIESTISLEMTKIIRDKILNLQGLEWVPMVLVGNKCDLASIREVSRTEGEELAARWSCPFIEASAKNNENIELVFQKMIDEIEKANNPEQADKKGCVLM